MYAITGEQAGLQSWSQNTKTKNSELGGLTGQGRQRVFQQENPRLRVLSTRVRDPLFWALSDSQKSSKYQNSAVVSGNCAVLKGRYMSDLPPRVKCPLSVQSISQQSLTWRCCEVPEAEQVKGHVNLGQLCAIIPPRSWEYRPLVCYCASLGPNVARSWLFSGQYIKKVLPIFEKFGQFHKKAAFSQRVN